MPLYEYRCPACGVFERLLRMGAAARETSCPACGAAAPRLLSTSGLSRARTAEARLIERTQATASEPGVVATPPAGPRRPARHSTNPLHRRLPRP